LRVEIPSGDPAAIVERALGLLLAQVERQKFAALGARRPPKAKAAVTEQDGGLVKCEARPSRRPCDCSSSVACGALVTRRRPSWTLRVAVDNCGYEHYAQLRLAFMRYCCAYMWFNGVHGR
jgi:hypothetical protein